MKFQINTTYKDGMRSTQYTYTLKKAIHIKRYCTNISKAKKVTIVATCILQKDADGDFEVFNKGQ